MRFPVPSLTRALLTLALLVGTFLPAGAPAAVAAPAVPLPHYRLDARVDLDGRLVRAQQTLRFVNVTGAPLPSVVLHSMAGAEGLLRIDAARVGGVDTVVDADASGSVLEIKLPTTLGPGEATSVDLEWTLDVPRAAGRITASGQTMSLGNWFPTLAVYNGGWDRRPFTEVGDAFFTEVADFDVALSLSRPATVASSGDVVSQTGTEWQLSAQGVRDFALSISAGYHQAAVQVPDGPLVEVYTLDPGRTDAYLRAAREFVEVFQQLVGPYPYPTLVVAETDLPASYAGMEYPRIVFLSRALSASSFAQSPARYVIAHELAHQWFYGLVGDDQKADPWLDEAFATYVAVQAYEWLSPATAATEERARLAPPGVYGPVDSGVFDFPSDSPYFDIVYRRGGRFLAEMRRVMGDEAWGTFLRTTFETYHGKVATPRAVLDLAQRLAPAADLQSLYAAYTRYGAFTYPEPRQWSVTVPSGPWSGTVPIDVQAAFPVISVEARLDGRPIAAGSTVGTYEADVAAVPAGEHVFLTRIVDDEGAIFERASRVTVLP